MKKTIQIFNSHQAAAEADRRHYASMSYTDKLKEIEYLRQLQIKNFPQYGTEQRLQRVYRIVKRTSD